MIKTWLKQRKLIKLRENLVKAKESATLWELAQKCYAIKAYQVDAMKEPMRWARFQSDANHAGRIHQDEQSKQESLKKQIKELENELGQNVD